jgi:hypothetical protein
MAQQLIPLDNSPNQTWQVTVSINGIVQTFFVLLDYNEIAEYWVMSVFDSNQNPLLNDVPLVTGLNLLRQYQYLGIGSLYLLNVSSSTNPVTSEVDYPDNTNLGTTYQMIWSDNTVLPVAA